MFIYGADDAVGRVVFFVRYTSPDLFLALTSLCVRTTRYVDAAQPRDFLSNERTSVMGLRLVMCVFDVSSFFPHT